MAKRRLPTLEEALAINDDLPASVFVFGHEIKLKLEHDPDMRGDGTIEFDGLEIHVRVTQFARRQWYALVEVFLDDTQRSSKGRHCSERRPTWGEAIIECERAIQKDHARLNVLWEKPK